MRDDGAAGDTLDVGDERDATRVVFEARVVQAGGRGITRREF